MEFYRPHLNFTRRGMPKSDAAQLKSAIATATRAVEYARRVANADETKLEMFINHLYTLSELRVEEGEFMRAESLLREACFRIDEAVAHHRNKPDPLIPANVASSMGFLYDRWGKADKAREWYKKSLGLAQTGGFLDSDLGASVSNNLGMIEKKDANFHEAEIHYRNAFRIFQQIKGHDSPDAAAVLNNLGVLLYTAKRHEEALQAHLSAMEIRQKQLIHGNGEDDLRQTWQNLAAVYKMLGKHEEAAGFLRKVGASQSPSETTAVSWMVSNFRDVDPALTKAVSTNSVLNGTHAASVNGKSTHSPNQRGKFKVEVFDID
jgi:tetratricopeptide (TPR) repeat protein